MNNLNQDLTMAKNFKGKVAEKISNMFINSADESSKMCTMPFSAEPKFPIELLKDDLND